MKLAITSLDGKFDTAFSPRFGRCDYFVFIDSETRDWEAKPNPAVAARGGAGPQAVQFLSSNGVEAIISGRYGPNAFSALDAADIQAFVADGGTPQELLEKFLAGELKQVNAATGNSLHR
ncbi:MAG: NifB/NifX family molybdenum-iron cluster-binding protein [Chloroflexota bacterium]|nr:NifB/NifX family molybdenum-iron cluster-binding protein [Chloroflexota bacterium]